MHTAAVPAKPTGLALMFGWNRIAVSLAITVPLAVLVNFGWTSGFLSLLVRLVTLGLFALFVFGLFEQWPKRLPRWLARWVLQVVAVAVTMPFATAIIYALTTKAGAPPFYHVPERMEGFSMLAGLGVFIAPWVALAALVRQKEAVARHQALAFSLERSELERQALDARLQLLQAQVAPHFLFNTLANVQELVDTSSPRASEVLQSLITYLRAAVPHMDEPVSTVGEEVRMVRAYLELMQMRMPDRLQFAIDAEPSTHGQRCPPMTLLTLVENAVRHGLDPSEEGGHIDVRVERRGDRCVVRVSDTGVGLREGPHGLGTGLTTLRERLDLVFGGDARLVVGVQQPRGVTAEIDLPARERT